MKGIKVDEEILAKTIMQLHGKLMMGKPLIDQYRRFLETYIANLEAKEGGERREKRLRGVEG